MADHDDETVTIQCTRNEARALADLVDREIQGAPPPPLPGECDCMAGILEASVKKAAELRDRLRAA
jgi:hypothetical protein